MKLRKLSGLERYVLGRDGVSIRIVSPLVADPKLVRFCARKRDWYWRDLIASGSGLKRIAEGIADMAV
jgi:hypothetical protein